MYFGATVTHTDDEKKENYEIQVWKCKWGPIVSFSRYKDQELMENHPELCLKTGRTMSDPHPSAGFMYWELSAALHSRWLENNGLLWLPQ